MVTLCWLSLLVLSGLFLVHLCFGSQIGHPPQEVLILILARSFVIGAEIWFLRSRNRVDAERELRLYALLSIVVNLMFAFALGYVADLHDSHYHVLLLLPIVAAALDARDAAAQTVASATSSPTNASTAPV